MIKLDYPWGGRTQAKIKYDNRNMVSYFFLAKDNIIVRRETSHNLDIVREEILENIKYAMVLKIL